MLREYNYLSKSINNEIFKVQILHLYHSCHESKFVVGLSLNSNLPCGGKAYTLCWDFLFYREKSLGLIPRYWLGGLSPRPHGSHEIFGQLGKPLWVFQISYVSIFFYSLV